MTTAPSGPGGRTYRIRVCGHLDDHWSSWLGDLLLDRRDDGTTTLTGPMADQAQLHAVLTRVRDLGATLLELQVIGGNSDSSCSDG